MIYSLPFMSFLPRRDHWDIATKFQSFFHNSSYSGKKWLLKMITTGNPLPSSRIGEGGVVLGGALSAVRAQCNYLGVWPY